MNTLLLCDKTDGSFYDKFGCFMGIKAALEKIYFPSLEKKLHLYKFSLKLKILRFCNTHIQKGLGKLFRETNREE